jgi:hypothetical protein
VPSARTTAVARRALVWRAAVIFAPANAETYRTHVITRRHIVSLLTHRIPRVRVRPHRASARVSARVSRVSRVSSGLRARSLDRARPSRIALAHLCGNVHLRPSNRSHDFIPFVSPSRVARARSPPSSRAVEAIAVDPRSRRVDRRASSSSVRARVVPRAAPARPARAGASKSSSPVRRARSTHRESHRARGVREWRARRGATRTLSESRGRPDGTRIIV